MTTWSSLNLQEANSSLMEQLTLFHDHSMMILIMITILVGYMMMTVLTNKIINCILMEN